MEQAQILFGDVATITHSFDEELEVALPTDTLVDDIASGRRVPERDDYLAALVAGLVDGYFVNGGMSRIERRRAAATALAGVPASDLEAALTDAGHGGLSPAIAAVLERRTAGSQPAA